MTRTFIAIPIPKGDPVDARSPAAPAHLTLRFLGEVPEAAFPRLQDEIARELEGRRPFVFVLGGMDAFPSRGRPRIVFRATAEGTDDLLDLARRVGAATERAGVPGDARPFVPHVTVLRIRSPRDASRARAILEGPAPTALRIEVEEVHLMASRLTPHGPEHELRARFSLRADGA